ncbi:MAG: DUF3168 domain-containing protein [Chloroflexi bacterium]|nr:DUF3168 domain-containing protein [Chloroflexota bacterium]
MTVDPLATLLAHLRADAEIARLTGGRVFGGDRPAGPEGSLAASPLGPSIDARLSGGRPHPDLPLIDAEVELRCWGGPGPGGPHAAVELWGALHAAVNVGGLDVAGAHLLWAVEAGGPVLLRDPETGEAYVRAALRVATAG